MLLTDCMIMGGCLGGQAGRGEPLTADWTEEDEVGGGKGAGLLPVGLGSVGLCLLAANALSGPR